MIITDNKMLFTERSDEANRRIAILRQTLDQEIAKIPSSKEHPSLCIYATGSLARHEATAHSDLDAFFLLTDGEKKKPLGRIRDVKILNAVLVAQEAAQFPDFSNDGAYLKFLYIDDVVGHIGGREDDYKNAFTARILLLTESCYLFGKENYEAFLNKIVDVYFQDFHSHSENFKPIFLINDILRFWRTLCLNYENARHWRADSDPIRRAKGHLDNLKLKFSRLNICYSFICHLLSQGPALTRENVLITSKLTPISRLQEIEQSHATLKAITAEMCEHYSWFLQITDRPKDSMLAWISEQSNREEAFSHADRFIDLTGKLTRAIAEKNDYLRYLIV